ncbi:MAG TPA: hypothetical protein VFY54_05145 [Rubrobacter sp.]|nr:hypothetical protein [Rubrobacter sp.]
MKHLPPTFTWKGFLEWAEEINPDVPFEEVQRIFERGCEAGYIKPAYVSEDGEFTYTLEQPPTRRMAVVVVKKRRDG